MTRHISLNLAVYRDWETIAAVDWLRRQVHLPSVDIILGLSPSELVNVEPTDVNLAEMVRLHDVCAVYRDWETDRKSTRLNSSHSAKSRMPSSA